MDESAFAALAINDDKGEKWLCNRCQRLDLESFLPSRCHKQGGIATIALASLTGECQLCRLFCKIFKHYESTKDASSKLVDLQLHWRHRNPEQGWFELFAPGQSFIQRLLPIEPLCPRERDLERPTPLIGRVVHPEASLSLASEWYQNCCLRHRPCLRSISPNGPQTTLRVIDCNTRQLVSINNGHKYVALSYVWNNQSDIEAQGTKGCLPRQLPATIEDAITVAIFFGIPFIWIDRYCIDQNNDKEKHALIRNMDSVYREAEMTIIAAAGLGPSHGLPGVSRTLREMQSTVNLERYTFGSMIDPRHEIYASKWWTRGWTYQEMILSRRRLVFTDSQMYFQCQILHCSESLANNLHPSSIADRLPLAFSKLSLGTLYGRIQEYYQRELSFDTDGLNAIAGILKDFPFLHGETDDRAVHHFWGIPTIQYNNPEETPQSLSLGLNFQSTPDAPPNNHTFRVRPLEVMSSFATGLTWTTSNDNITGTPRRRDGNWPTWSWVAHKHGSLDLPPNRLRWLGRINDVDIMVTNKSGWDEPITIENFHNSGADFLGFSPVLQITSWALPSPVWGSELRLHFDHQITEVPECEVMALFLGTKERKNDLAYAEAKCLIVRRKVGDEYFERIGVATVILQIIPNRLGKGSQMPHLLNVACDEGAQWSKMTILLA